MKLAFITGLPGWGELLLILAVILLIFGAKRLPELARALGKSIGEFRKGREEGAHGKQLNHAPEDTTEDKSGTDSR